MEPKTTYSYNLNGSHLPIKDPQKIEDGTVDDVTLNDIHTIPAEVLVESLKNIRRIIKRHGKLYITIQDCEDDDLIAFMEHNRWELVTMHRKRGTNTISAIFKKGV